MKQANQANKVTLRLELLWWAVTIILGAIILLPIYRVRPSFPFWISNITYIFIAITFIRYIFLLKHTVLAHRQWLKVIVLFLCIPLCFYLISSLNFFQQYVNEFGLEELFDDLSLKGQTSMVKYIRTEMIFFGVSAIIATIAMPFRMLVSYWRTYNHGTV